MSKNSLKPLTPRAIVEELDRYIIGQDDAKKAVAIALRNRWRRQQDEHDAKKAEYARRNIQDLTTPGEAHDEERR